MEKDKEINKDKEIKKIAIIGRGNVGSHLKKALENIGKSVIAIASREEFPNLSDYDLIIIAVKDDYIKDVALKLREALKNDNARPIVVHTSGSVNLSVLTEILPERIAAGVFYPMQTFSKGVDMRYDNIPFLLEASDPSTLERLKLLASEISSNVQEADSEIRAKYHIGAVLTCNFTNHLCALTDEYLQANGLKFNTLLPLLSQTISKLNSTSPAEAQTGPAIRGDHKVIDYHFDKLREYPELLDIYKYFSESISKFHSK